MASAASTPEPSVAASEGNSVEVTLEPGRDSRLIGFVVVALVCVCAALIVGRVELVAFAAPFIVALLVAEQRAAPMDATVSIELLATRVVEGDVIAGTIHISRPEGTSLTVNSACPKDLDVLRPDHRSLDWTVGVSEAGVCEFEVTAVRWGRFTLGPLRITARQPNSLIVWRGLANVVVAATVLPAAPRLDRLLEPASSRANAGSHLDRRALGRGIDFAEIRPYQSGDRLRDLNRAATARTASAHVNDHHPERSGDVVMMIDSYIDSGVQMSEAARQALLITARATWAIARSHLSYQDRVGIGSVGRLPIWLPPGGGARTRYAILETLMNLGKVFETRGYQSGTININRVPPSALVVLISPLWDTRPLGTIRQLRARGREVAVLQLGTEELLPPAKDELEEQSRRLFRARVDTRVMALQSIGIPVVEWNPEASLGSAIGVAASAQRRRRSVGFR